MKANELMIGDWIHNKFTNENYRVWPTFYSQCTDYGRTPERDIDELFEPIPLTPGILEKNGFTKDEEIDQWYFESDDRLDMGLLAVGIDDGCGTGFCVMPNGAITYYCKHVHELQHYLRLIGGAKEIEL